MSKQTDKILYDVILFVRENRTLIKIFLLSMVFFAIVLFANIVRSMP